MLYRSRLVPLGSPEDPDGVPLLDEDELDPDDEELEDELELEEEEPDEELEELELLEVDTEDELGVTIGVPM